MANPRALGHLEEHMGRLPELLGFHFVSVDAERAHVRLEAQPALLHGFGALHGGVLFSMADSAAAILVFHAGGERGGTTDASIRFLAPVRSGAVDAIARILHEKGRTVLVEVELRDAEGELVALYSGHFVRSSSTPAD